MKLYTKFFSLFSLMLLAGFNQPLLADDAIGSKPIPGSAHEIESSMDGEFSQETPIDVKLDEFLESSEVVLKLRNYYLNKSKPSAEDSYAWAQGGILSYKAGRLGGIFSLNAELMGSFPLDAPEENDGTKLLEEGQNSIVELGVLNPKITVASQVLSLYRQRYNLPYVNDQDNRMLPNTFEGYTLGMPIAASKNFQYIVGYIDSIKGRDSDEFVSMSDAAGVNQLERGLFVGGARGYFMPEWSLAAINYYLEDVIDIFYAESIYKGELCDEVQHTLSAQYSSQASVGDDLLRGGEDYSAAMWGVQSALSYQGAVLKLSFNMNDSGGLMRSPYGSYPGYNSVMVEDFNRANEKSWQAAISYDLGKIGVDGVSVAAAYISGNDAIDETTRVDLADKDEADFTIDYRPKGGILDSVWFRFRTALVNDEDSGQLEDYRVIVNYDIPLFGPKKEEKAS